MKHHTNLSISGGRRTDFFSKRKPNPSWARFLFFVNAGALQSETLESDALP